MKFIVDEYPVYNSSCPFCEEGYKENKCRLNENEYPNTYERPVSCALISYEDFMTELGKRND